VATTWVSHTRFHVGIGFSDYDAANIFIKASRSS
jgi:hypothetical protein